MDDPKDKTYVALKFHLHAAPGSPVAEIPQWGDMVLLPSSVVEPVDIARYAAERFAETFLVAAGVATEHDLAGLNECRVVVSIEKK